MKIANLTRASPIVMMQRRNVNWVTELKNQVRKTWGVTHVLLIMEKVLLIKVLNLRNKSHFITWVGEGRGGKGNSILVVTINRVSQFSLVPPLYSCSDDWSYLRSLWKPGDPAPPARLTHPSHPSFQAKNGDLFLTSAQRFSENIKFMISCLSL